MNEFLAEMYDTRESIGVEGSGDVEKLAEAQLLDEALQAEGVNIDDLPGDTILKLAYQILGEDSHLVKAAMVEAGEDEAEGKKEKKEEEDEEPMEEKVAQADFLGRVMAHSYVNELGEIEKNAATGAFGRAAGAVGRFGKDVGEGFKGLGYMAKSPREAVSALKQSLKEQGLKGTLKGSHAELKALGVTGAGAGALGAGGYGASKAFGGKKKKASALDALAEQRAVEWAESVGLTGGGNEKLAAAVDARAYEMLREEGIDVDAVEAAL